MAGKTILMSFANMAANDELISKMYKFHRKLRPRHFKNVSQVKNELSQKCLEYFVGDISPLEFYVYCYNLYQEYLKSVKFITADTFDFEDYLTELIENEKAFNRKAGI